MGFDFFIPQPWAFFKTGVGFFTRVTLLLHFQAGIPANRKAIQLVIKKNYILHFFEETVRASKIHITSDIMLLLR